MSYKFDGTGDYLRATLGTSLDFPITVLFWMRAPADPPGLATSVDYYLNLGVNTPGANAQYNSIVMFCEAPSTDRYYAATIDGAGSSSNSSMYAAVANTYDAIWIPVVGVFSGAASTTCTGRQVYVNAYANNDATPNTTSYDLGANVLYLSIGAGLHSGGAVGAADPDQTRIAAVAIWDAELSESEITSLLGGTIPSDVASGSLRAYWSLESDATQTAGADSVGSLTVTGAAVDAASNPTLDSGTAAVADLTLSVQPSTNPDTKIYMTWQT